LSARSKFHSATSSLLKQFDSPLQMEFLDVTLAGCISTFAA
jgi:hypothetical protein